MNSITSVSCDNEPIHLINELQDFGFIIILSLTDELIIACGENATEYFGISSDELLEKSPSVIFENFGEIKSSIEEILIKKDYLEYKTHFYYQGLLLFATFRKSDIFFLCEIERENQIKILEIENEISLQVSALNKIHSMEELCNLAVERIRILTQFNRVVIYRFKKDFSGEVIAESRDESLPSILGFHFPASDIPLSARAVYLKNPLRLIKSNQQKKINLKKSKEFKNYSFDIGASILRAPHLHHLEYLSNMGINTSMSISLMDGNNLWGLFICHSLSENIPSLSIRNFLSIYSRMVFIQIDLLNKNNISLKEIQLQNFFISLIKKINTVSINQVLDIFKSESNSLMKEFQSDGFFIHLRNQSFGFGAIPEEPVIIKIVHLLSERFSNTFFFTNDLKESFPNYFDSIEKANGLLSMPLSSDPKDRIIWFRGDVLETITWGGNKNEAFIVKNDQISPRKSFSRWIETVKGKSTPWSELHIKFLNEIYGIVEIIDKKIAEDNLEKTLEQVRKSERELRELNGMKDKFFSIVSHNLRNPFSGLLGVSELLTNYINEGGDSIEEIKEQAMLIHISSLKSFELLKNLFEWGKIQTGKIEIEKRDFNLVEIMNEVIYNISEKIKKKEITLITEYKDSIILSTDENALKVVLTNLLLNAVKYSYKNNAIKLRAFEFIESVTIEVEDSGIGMEADELLKLFSIEEHFNMPGTIGESGTGLGLIITKEYLNKLNAKIEVVSQKNMGTKVTVITQK